MLLKLKLNFSFLFLLLILWPRSSQALFTHKHQDLFSENDVLLGLKLGPQINGYTNIQKPDAIVSVQSSVRFMTGLAAEFIYDLPRFEIDFFYSSRSALNSSTSFQSLSFPILAKIPLSIDQDMDLEFGAGSQFEFIVGGEERHRSSLVGLLASMGLLVDFEKWLFSAEVRYVFGLNNIDANVNGGKPRDFQIIFGGLWHF